MSTHTTKTVFITGGSSGIGEGLARAYHARGVTVIIAARNAAEVNRVTTSCPGMQGIVLDVSDAEAVARCATDLSARFPGLNTVINNAGIQRELDFSAAPLPSASAVAEEVGVNLTGVLNVTIAFLPLLRRQPASRLVNVGSGLAFVPLVAAPIYSATKAAVRAFTIALREQLRGTSVQVVELIPPVVESNLHRGQSRKPPKAMALETFIEKAMQALDSGREELPVGLAAVLRIGVRIAPKRFLRIVNPLVRG